MRFNSSFVSGGERETHPAEICQYCPPDEYANRMQIGSFHHKYSRECKFCSVFIDNVAQQNAVNKGIYVLTMVRSVVGIF